MFFKTRLQELAIVAGCGNFGSIAASKLSDQGKDVVIIDICSDAFNKLNGNYEVEQVEADATDIDILKQCGIEHAPIFISATGDDNTNLMIAEFASEIFKVSKVIARIYDYESKEPLLKEFNITPICSHLLAIKEIEEVFLT